MQQLAFWVAEDMNQAEDSRQLLLLPIGLRYRWRRQNWQALDQRLKALEQHLGLNSLHWDQSQAPNQHRRQRLLAIGAALMKALEQLERLQPNADLSLQDRSKAFRLHGLAKSEDHFGLRGHGTLQERCERLNRPPGTASTARS